MNCYSCGQNVEIIGRVGKRDCCSKCGADLHCCYNCRFYDRSAHNQCRETQAEWERFKEKNNYCDYFEPAAQAGGGKAAKEADAARAAFDKLFKK